MLFIRKTFLTLAAVLCCLTGCAGESELFSYQTGDASFSAVFPSVSGDTEEIVCSCTRDGGGNYVMIVSSPPRLKGFTVQMTGEGVSCGVADMMIPLSRESSSQLSRVFLPLSLTGAVKKSPDGRYTVVETDMGQVTLDEHGRPVSVTTDTRTVTIRDWQSIPPSADATVQTHFPSAEGLSVTK